MFLLAVSVEQKLPCLSWFTGFPCFLSFFVILSHKCCTISSEYVISNSPHLFLISYSSRWGIKKSYYFPTPENHDCIFVFFLIYLLFYFLTLLALCWWLSSSLSKQGPSLVVACAPHGGTSPVVENGFSGVRASVAAARGLLSCGCQAPEHSLVVVAPGLICSAVCGFFLDQGSNPRLLHWKVDSLPLSHRGSP